ncbi:MAG TPA: MBOAT family O-acyltransferase [Oligoflexus sp.]|uniref:MBOAT family O-acyltransferase n=1 Tax=Oligoflexus sp. TaxID=1971216 RepID=UPI002D5D0D1A|nr:MBOAT family O-acyltransferase [Oligoflexus sp.]HYX35352.1 MBOAT family O-acyltransferase [Oligoflexus sp.]
MVFSSMQFLFVFFPVVFGVYFVLPTIRLKNLFLLFASLMFYIWGERNYVFVMLASITITWAGGVLLEKSRSDKERRIALATGIIVNLLLLAYYKYAVFLIQSFGNALALVGIRFAAPENLQHVHLPAGISFFTFQAISYLIDLNRGTIKCQRNLATFGMYKSFFPQLIAGPIVRYAHIEKEVDHRPVSWAHVTEGISIFCVGLAQKILLANPMGQLADDVFNSPLADLTSASTWLGATAYDLQIFFDFSGYSQMAIGLGRMFGFTFPQNFNVPYTASSITDFWRRWHMSLSSWFRDYLYIPLGGNRCSKTRNFFNLFIVFFLCGLWHGASWTFVIWGAYHGLFLCLEKAGLLEKLNKAPVGLSRLYAMLVVLVGWVFFRADSLTYALGFLKKMFGLDSTPLSADRLSLYDLLNYERIVVFSIALVLSAQLYPKLPVFQSSERPHPLAEIVRGVALSGVFLLSLVYLAGSTFNPFIYFRF